LAVCCGVLDVEVRSDAHVCGGCEGSGMCDEGRLGSCSEDGVGF
jgi:hypothetical protein